MCAVSSFMALGLATPTRSMAGTISDLHIEFSPMDDTAIASYVLHLTTREATKKVHTEDYQESDVWFKTSGGWKITHVHYSAAPKLKKPDKKA